jgi:hypothetical protein
MLQDPYRIVPAKIDKSSMWYNVACHDMRAVSVSRTRCPANYACLFNEAMPAGLRITTCRTRSQDRSKASDLNNTPEKWRETLAVRKQSTP